MADSKTNLAIKDDTDSAPTMEPWKIQILVLGGLLGASLGLASSFLLIKNSERSGVRPSIGTREGFKLLVLSIGLIRNIASLWED